jgi:hypothetical protein
MNNFKFETYIERYAQFIYLINENITYSEFDNFIEGGKFLLNNIYIAAGEEFCSNLKLEEIMINHQYQPHPNFIACCIQGYNAVFSKEDELVVGYEST